MTRSGEKRMLTRREMLTLLSVFGIGGTAICSAGGLLTIYLALADRKPVELVSTATPISIDPNIIIERPAITSRVDWGALDPNHEARFETGSYSLENPEGWYIYDQPISDMYQTVIIHHSVVDEGDDIQTLLDIQNFHRNDRGWADVAYHYFVGQSGIIYEGRDINVRGTHVANFNTGSVGVCLLGNFMNSAPTIEQIDSTRRLIQWLAQELQLSHLAGHYDFNDQTQCPGDNLVVYLDDFAQASSLERGTDGYISPDEEASLGFCLCCDCHI